MAGAMCVSRAGAMNLRPYMADANAMVSGQKHACGRRWVRCVGRPGAGAMNLRPYMAGA
jgi:hypothetical protein